MTEQVKTVEVPSQTMAMAPPKFEMADKKRYVKRSSTVDVEQFLNTIVRPILSHVVSKDMKKNLGFTVAALCGHINMLPIHADYAGKTNPFQTFSSVLSRKPLHVDAAVTPMAETVIPVVAQMNAAHGVPQVLIDAFVERCNHHGVDHSIFTNNGGNIALTEPFLKAVIEWAACDAWGEIKPIKKVSRKFRD